MKTILNILWLVFSGIWLAIAYTLMGVIMCILIITIPFGIERLFRRAGYVLWLFGRTACCKRARAQARSIGRTSSGSSCRVC